MKLFGPQYLPEFTVAFAETLMTIWCPASTTVEISNKPFKINSPPAMGQDDI
jgi:hypothetical protein